MSLSAENGTESTDDNSLLAYESDEHWKWRYLVAEKIADLADFDRFGIQAIYLIGSTKNACAGPASDIDLMVHFRGNEGQKQEFQAWIEGWGLGLAELNYHKTGYSVQGSLIDCHILTDDEILKNSSYASMIGSLTNSAKLLRSKSTP
jgi:DNA polymerase sigma